MSDSRGAKMAQSKSIEEEWGLTWQQAKLPLQKVPLRRQAEGGERRTEAKGGE